MRLRALLGAAVLMAASAAQAQPAPFEPEPWLADLAQLRGAMTAGYANLEWASQRGMDLPAVYARAETRLKRARDAYEARRALDRFVEAFDDGHLELRWPRPAPAPRQASAGPAQLCERLGYFDAGNAGIATRLPGFRPVGAADALFTAGLADGGGRRVGVLQIPVFSFQGFPALCEGLLKKARLTPESPCDGPCRQQMTAMAETAFVVGFRDQLTALAAERPDAVLIDIAGNGGGDDSSRVLARLVTDRPIHRPPAGLVRSEPTAVELGDRLAAIQAGLRTTRGVEHAALARLALDLKGAQAEARQPCDRTDLWRGAPIECTGIVAEPVYTGPAPHRGPRRPAWVDVAEPQARFPAVEPVWRGPLLVLVDEQSASSSELFAAVLQDAGAAVIVGARTARAGCGHMSSARPIVLANSGAELSMPDCLRRRADGTNEVAGVRPDVSIELRATDTAKTRTELLAAALPAALRKAMAGR